MRKNTTLPNKTWLILLAPALLAMLQVQSAIASGTASAVAYILPVIPADPAAAPLPPVVITGRVSNKDGESLAGVTVRIQGSQVNAITDANGRYSISAPDNNAVLQFSFIGYQTLEVKAGSRTSIDVQLSAGSKNLSEVVVTALGIERQKASLGYATQKVSGAELNEAPATNFISNISGKVAGVNIVASGGVGGTSRITIRGESSLSMQSNQPLFVIDGVPVANDGVNNTSGNADYGSSAGEINTADIESMNVLKGPAAAALYGSRAANGAVVITTKKGASRKGIGVSYNTYYFMEEVGRLPKFQNEFGQGSNGLFEGSNFGASWSAYPDGVQDGYDEGWGPRLNTGVLKKQFNSPTTNGFRGADVAVANRGDVIATPWVAHPENIRDFFNTGAKYFNNLAFSGGNEKGNYRLSLTSQNEKGVIPNNDLDRYQVSLNSSYNLSSKLTSSINFNYAKQKSTNRTDNGYGRNTFMYFFTWMPRNVDINAMRNYWQPGFEGIRQFQYNYGENHNNPFFLQYEDTKGQDKNHLYGNIALEYAFTDKLKLKVRTAEDHYDDFRPMRWAVSTVDYENGRYEEVNIKYEERNTDFLLTYNDAFAGGDVNYNVSIGGNQFDQSGNNSSTAAPALLVPGVYNLGNTASPLTAYSNSFRKRINSLYAMASFDYKKLVYLDLTARNDWSSTLPENNNSYFYPSVGINTDLKQLFKAGDALSQAQLRFSWAQVGNDAGPYQINNTYGYGAPWGNNYSLVGNSTLMNSDLKPEITSTYEVGTALGFFKNRLGLDLTYYDIRSRNQIVSLPLVQSSGATNKLINAGEIKNTGVEVMLTAVPVDLPRSLSWSFNINFSRNVGRVVALTDEVDKIVQAAPGEDASIQARVGEKMGAIYGPGYQRVPDGPMKGQIIIFSDGAPAPTTEDIYLGNLNPDWIGSIYNKLSYRNFNLSFLIGGQYGGRFISRFYNKAVGAGEMEESALGRSARTPGKEYDAPYYIPGAAKMTDGSYQPNSTSTDGTFSTGVYGTDVRYFIKKPLDHISEAQLFDATYFKLRELTIGYNFPSAWLGRNFIKSARFSLTGRNLLLWTPKSNKHFDPEVATATSGNGLVPGFENMSTPGTREMGASLNINF